jgi:dynein assembly factor 1
MFNRKTGKAEMSLVEDGLNKLTPEYIVALCEENKQYATPHLNDVLYLHFKGFKKIEALEKYTELKSIWLESNGIEKIDGLDTLTKLKMM